MKSNATVLQKLLVGHAILILLCAWLPGEQGSPFLVEVDQILGVGPALEFILWRSQCQSLGNGENVLTVFKRDMSAHPRSA